MLLWGCGDSLPISPVVLTNLKNLVTKYVYCSNESSCAEGKSFVMAKDEKKTTLRLMPDEDTLNYICVRVPTTSHIASRTLD